MMGPVPIPEFLTPGRKVRWREPRHACALGWEDAYGPGPFEVVRWVDKSHQDIPPAALVKTLLGYREINQVWLVPADEQVADECYSLDVLSALDDEDPPLAPFGED
jgi:hypothetical protein